MSAAAPPAAGRRRLLPRRRPPRAVADARMSLVDHLRELRARLFKAVLAIAVITLLVGVVGYHPIEHFIRQPYCDVDPKYRFGDHGCALIFTSPLDGFLYRLKISLIAGLVLSGPFWLYQLWAFVTPGLHRNERRHALTFVGASSVLFAAGAALAYLVLHKSLDVLLSFGGDGLQALLAVDKYLSFVIGMLLVFGLAFEFPLLVIMLNFVGVLPSDKLRSSRRVALFLCFLFAGVATPSQDPFSMLALAVPLCLLFEMSVLVARLHDRSVRKRELTAPYAGLDDDETSPLDLSDGSLPDSSPSDSSPSDHSPSDHSLSDAT